MNKFYITTAIDYVNDTIHLGHAFQKIAADVLARHKRHELGKENVFFLTGTDEYGQKAEKAARALGVQPLKYVKKISDSDQKQQDALNISYDRFIRTTDTDHAKVVSEIWKKVEQSGDIYKGEYSGLYCEGCEGYYTETDLENGKCPVHPSLEVKKITEENYFFKWSKYKNFLIDHIKNNPDFIFPKHRANEMLEFAKEIKDIPISRTNFSWGIPVPNKPRQVIYVWFDALINYLTGIGFLENKKNFEKFWPADVHILGKDNLRWHSLLWPAMLKSANLPLPKTILVNGFLKLNGEKISKSLGNVIKPTEWVEKYGADAVRYYLLRHTVFTEDSDISEEKLKQAYNSDLANGLGNLVARVLKLSKTSGFLYKTTDKIVSNDKVKKHIQEFSFNSALFLIWQHIELVNKEINNDEPWKIKDKNKLHEKLHSYTKDILLIANDLKPFLPQTAEKIENKFIGNVSEETSLFPRIH